MQPMTPLSEPSAFEAFAKQALGEFCDKLPLEAPQAVTHFLVARDPVTGETLKVPRLHQVEWTGMDHLKVRIAEHHFVEKNDVLAAVSLWCEVDEGFVVMVVQHRQGTVAGRVSAERVDANWKFGQLEPLTPEFEEAPSLEKSHV